MHSDVYFCSNICKSKYRSQIVRTGRGAPAGHHPHFASLAAPSASLAAACSFLLK